MSISRRSFLQGVGIGCSACALGAFPPGALARNPIAGINGKTTLTPSLCEMCSFRCPIQAQVVNNKTVFIQGNPSAPQQGTRICARGGSGVSLVNDPQIWRWISLTRAIWFRLATICMKGLKLPIPMS